MSSESCNKKNTWNLGHFVKSLIENFEILPRLDIEIIEPNELIVGVTDLWTYSVGTGCPTPTVDQSPDQPTNRKPTENMLPDFDLPSWSMPMFGVGGGRNKRTTFVFCCFFRGWFFFLMFDQFFGGIANLLAAKVWSF